MRLRLTGFNGWLDLDLCLGEPDASDPEDPSFVVVSDTERDETPVGFAPTEPDED
ncbi:MAG: hypothetical protein ABW143_02530 [Acidimicrobiales bacterium]